MAGEWRVARGGEGGLGREGCSKTVKHLGSNYLLEAPQSPSSPTPLYYFTHACDYFGAVCVSGCVLLHAVQCAGFTHGPSEGTCLFHTLGLCITRGCSEDHTGRHPYPHFSGRCCRHLAPGTAPSTCIHCLHHHLLFLHLWGELSTQ